MTKRRLSPDEHRAWTKVVKSVKPLSEREITFEMPEDMAVSRQLTAAAEPSRPRPKMPAKLRPADAVKPKRAPPANRSREKKVRRGQTVIAATFDLHGHTQESGAKALTRFLTSQRADGARCVLVITGKGKAGEGVLRKRFMDWVQTAEAGSVMSGYAPAHIKHGGSGAFYVFLRRRKR